MNEVNHVAEETAHLAGSGQTGIGRMEATMRQIMDASGSITSKLAVLNEKTTNINSVVTTITKVADQTNLLSLNAAIEAEKAGADFIVFGPIFDSPGKKAVGLEPLSRVVSSVRVPVIAIGGISAANSKEVLGIGAAGIAGIRLFQTD